MPKEINIYQERKTEQCVKKQVVKVFPLFIPTVGENIIDAPKMLNVYGLCYPMIHFSNIAIVIALNFLPFFRISTLLLFLISLSKVVALCRGVIEIFLPHFAYTFNRVKE